MVSKEGGVLIRTYSHRRAEDENKTPRMLTNAAQNMPNQIDGDPQNGYKLEPDIHPQCVSGECVCQKILTRDADNPYSPAPCK